MAQPCQQTTDQNYVLGRGRLYFDKFRDGCSVSEFGEHYIGNTPELSMTSDSETLDHYNSDSGLREKDMTVLLEHSRSGSFQTDNISATNLSLFFLGTTETMVQAQVTGAKEVLNGETRKGRFYQLGTSKALPTGVRNIENLVLVTVSSDVSVSLGDGDITAIEGAKTIPLFGNVDYDLDSGRIYIEPDAPDIEDGQQIVAQYDVKAASRDIVIGRNRTIYGALRFISDNPVGENKIYYWPRVMLQPDGDYALKGDDWQTLGFSFSVLRLNKATEQVYIESVKKFNGSVVPPEDLYTVELTATPNTVESGDTVNATATVKKNGVVAQGVDVTLSVVGADSADITGGGVVNSNQEGKAEFSVVVTAVGSSKTAVFKATAKGVSSNTKAITVNPK